MPSEPDKATYALMEAAVDIALVAQWAIETKKWTPPPDSRELVSRIIAAAHEFEEKNATREWDGEYLEEIEAFALQKLEIL